MLRSSLAALLVVNMLVQLAVGFPAMMLKNLDSFGRSISDLQRRADANTTALAHLVTGLLNGTIPGTNLPPVVLPGLPAPIRINLPPVVVSGRKAIPDAAHPFRAPGPTDQRGGCPGLNMMANYGYISRNGITNPTELLYALQEMFGLAIDTSLVLAGLFFISAIDITTLKSSIGHSDPRTSGPLTHLFGQAPGLFDKATHNQYEIDGSIAYGDSAFSSDGNTDHFNSTYWAEAVAIANTTSGGIWNETFVANLRYQRYQKCVSTNPSCYWGPKELLFYIADNFSWLSHPSSGPDGNPGPATYDAMSAFWGVRQYPNGSYYNVPGRLPGNPTWYRRSTPLEAVVFATYGADAYAAHPVLFGGNQGRPNSFVPIPNQLPAALQGPQMLCFVFNTLQDNIPPYLSPVRQAVIDILNVFLAPARTNIGC